MKKFLRRSGFTFLALITLVALAYAIENWRGAAAWTAEQKRIRDRGEPLLWADLLGAAPAPEDNFAASPLFAGIFEYRNTKDAKGRDRFEYTGRDALKRLSDLTRVPLPLEDEPSEKLTQGMDLTIVAARFRAAPGFTCPEPSADPAKDLLACLASRQETFDLIEDAARRPFSRFPIRYEDADQALLPHLAHLKGSASLLQIRALARLQTGDSTNALADLHLILRIGQAAGADPVLIGALVQFAIENLAVATFWQGWRDSAWTDSQLAELQQRFSAIHSRSNILLALRGERIFSSTLYDLMREDPSRFWASDAEVGEGAPAGPSPSLRIMPSGWVRQNQATHSRVIDDMVRHAQERPEDRALSNDRVSLMQQLEAIPLPYSIMASMLLPALENSFKTADRQLVITQLAITVCALERHRIAHQRYPDSLAALTPAFIQSIPIDPIDGQPLRYSLEPDGSFRLYSIGLNARDDGGEAGKPRQDGPDWVWPQRKSPPGGRLF
jgi:hypothetical protein